MKFISHIIAPFFLVYCIIGDSLESNAQNQAKIFIRDTTLSEVIPRFNGLVADRNRINKEIDYLVVQIKQHNISIKNATAAKVEARKRIEAQVRLSYPDTLSIHDSIVKDFSLVGRIYANADDTVKIRTKNLEYDEEQLKQKSKERDSIQEGINILQRLIPTAARKHVGGYDKLMNRDNAYWIFVADIRTHDIQLRLIDTSTGKKINSLAKLKALLPDALMLTNAGMFNPSYTPQGLYLSWDTERNQYPLDTKNPKGITNFYMLPNGVFAMDTHGIPFVMETKAFQSRFKGQYDAIHLATQSGPMLLVDGNIHSNFTENSNNLHIRSGVGIIDSTKLVFAISKKPVNFYDFASLFKEVFLCENALYLDGAICEMYLRNFNEIDPRQPFGPMIAVTPKSKP